MRLHVQTELRDKWPDLRPGPGTGGHAAPQQSSTLQTSEVRAEIRNYPFIEPLNLGKSPCYLLRKYPINILFNEMSNQTINYNLCRDLISAECWTLLLM